MHQALVRGLYRALLPALRSAPRVPAPLMNDNHLGGFLAMGVPLEQWNVRREYLRRLKRAFDDQGIEIPFPQRTVHVVTEPKPGEAARPA